jgi:hypothetical protein
MCHANTPIKFDTAHHVAKTQADKIVVTEIPIKNAPTESDELHLQLQAPIAPTSNATIHVMLINVSALMISPF